MMHPALGQKLPHANDDESLLTASFLQGCDKGIMEALGKNGYVSSSKINRVIWSSLRASHSAQGYLIRAICAIMGDKTCNDADQARSDKESLASLEKAIQDIKYLSKKNDALKKGKKKLSKLVEIKCKEVSRLRAEAESKVNEIREKNYALFQAAIAKHQLAEARKTCQAKELENAALLRKLRAEQEHCFRLGNNLEKFRRSCKDIADRIPDGRSFLCRLADTNKRKKNSISAPKWHSSSKVQRIKPIRRPPVPEMDAMDEALARLEAKVHDLKEAI